MSYFEIMPGLNSKRIY